MAAHETPTGRLLGSWPSGSEEWHAARASRLGGSDMAAVLGRSPWVSPYRLWHLRAGLVDDPPATPEQQRGHYLEPAISAWWADQHPEFEVVEAGTYTHVDRDYQLANPDRLLMQDGRVVGLLELKSDAGDGDTWGRPGTDELPLYYRTQILWYLDVLGLDVAHVAMIGARLEFADYAVAYDPADAQILRAHAEGFLDSLLWREPPALDAADCTYRTVRELHPGIEDRTVELSLGQAAEFTKARDAKKTADADWNLARSRMGEWMGDAQHAEFLGRRIANRQAKADGTPFVVADRHCPPSTDFTPAEEITA